MSASQPPQTCDKGQLTPAAPVGTQYVSVHPVETHNKHDRTKIEEAYSWPIDDFEFLHVLLNEYDITSEQTVEIFHNVTDMRHKKHDYCFMHLRDMYKSRFTLKKSPKWRMVDRPNQWNTTPYTDKEVAYFGRYRETIETSAKELGIDIIHQTGISTYGVQVNLMHPAAGQPPPQSASSLPAAAGPAPATD